MQITLFDNGIPMIREVEIAKGLKEAIGLMFRKSTDKPMLFKYKELQHRSFHTYFMRFNLDMFFLDDKGIVTKVFRNIKPGNIAGAKCQYMLEAPSSWNLNFIKVGI